MPTGTTLAPSIRHDDDDVDDDDEDSEDEELRAWYDGDDGEWLEHDHVPYVSGGLPASFLDSEEEPLFVGGRSIFAEF